MTFQQAGAELFIPDQIPLPGALRRTTHLGIAAHPDDLEFMAIDGILHCFEDTQKWFCGVVLTDGAGSPQDERRPVVAETEMKAIRRAEQIRAAEIGRYGALIMLDYSSSALKGSGTGSPRENLRSILEQTRPQVVYTHNLADKHDTHVAVALRVIEAIRSLAPEIRPHRLYGCEVWRDLDWLADTDKHVFDVSSRPELQASLVGVFSSQVDGGKRYDLAVMGRRRAQATFLDAHSRDRLEGAVFSMDLTPLIGQDDLPVKDFLDSFLERFRSDVLDRLSRLSGT